MKWNSDQIMEDLKKIPGVSRVENSGQGGDVDSDNIVAYIDGTDEEEFVVAAGFVTDGDITTPGDCEVEMVELVDARSDCRGGLQSRHKTTRQVFHAIEDYLVDTYDAQVVRYMKDYF